MRANADFESDRWSPTARFHDEKETSGGGRGAHSYPASFESEISQAYPGRESQIKSSTGDRVIRAVIGIIH